MMVISVVDTASVTFGVPSIAGEAYYATGYQGIPNGKDYSVAIGQDEIGWIGTVDFGKSWERLHDLPGLSELGDITAAVVDAPGMIHNLGVPDTKDVTKVYHSVNTTKSSYVVYTPATKTWDVIQTNNAVQFREIPEPGISCGTSSSAFGCPFRKSGRGYVQFADGEMVMTIIVWWGKPHSNPHPKLAAKATSIIAFSSKDHGFTWDYAGKVLDAADVPDSEEGPNENDVVLLKDGKTIMSVIRLDAGDGPLTHPYRPYVTTFSTDRGKTWTKASSLAKGVGCARPRLMGTDSGAIALSGGRLNPTNRDVLLWINGKGDGVDWDEYSITYHHNQLVANQSLHFTPAVNDSRARETTSYTSLVKTGANSGFIIYARFRSSPTKSRCCILNAVFNLGLNIEGGKERERERE